MMSAESEAHTLRGGLAADDYAVGIEARPISATT
jgi:hypothetical protein